MGLACRITGHKWYKLPDGKDGCTCSRCGEHNSFGGCDWHKEPGNCEAMCSWCGRKEVRHEWNGCTCTWCGATSNYNHKWEYVSGTCDYKCSICGAISNDRKFHRFVGCTCTRCGTVRNKDHDFAPSEEDGTIRCTVCGISIDESRAQSVIEAFKEKPEGYWSFAYDLIKQIEDTACIVSVAPLMPRQAFERLGQLGADEELEAIACGTAGGYGYEMRREARRNIRDAALREGIDVKMTEEEQRWYDYDIKTGM